MYIANTAFNTAVNAYSRTFKVRLKHEDDTLINATVLTMSSQRGGTNGGLPFGGVFSHAVDIEMICDEDLTGQKIALEIGVLSGSEYEYIPFGRFSVASSKMKETVTAVRAYDALGITNGNKLSFSGPSTAGDVFRECAAALGVAFDNPDSIDVSMAIPEGKYEYDVSTALAYAAALVCANVFIGRSGKLEIHNFPTTTGTITNDIVSESEVTNMIKCTEISVDYGSGENVTITSQKSGSGIDDIVAVLGKAILGTSKLGPIFDMTDIRYSLYSPFVTDHDSAEALANRIKANAVTTAHVGKIEVMLGNPCIDPWDVIRHNNGLIYCELLPSDLHLEFDGGISMTIESDLGEAGETAEQDAEKLSIDYVRNLVMERIELLRDMTNDKIAQLRTETGERLSSLSGTVRSNSDAIRDLLSKVSAKLDISTFDQFYGSLDDTTIGIIYGTLKTLPVADMNNLKTPGVYLVVNDSKPSNYPSTNGSRIEVIKLGGSYIKQIVHPNATSCTHYERVWNGSAWGTWMKFTGTAV